MKETQHWFIRTTSYVSVSGLTYFMDGRRLTYFEMKEKCEVRHARLCYFNELCPQGGSA